MIKITYKKALNVNFELSACSNGHNFSQSSVLNNKNMSKPFNKSNMFNKKTAEAVINKSPVYNKNIVNMSKNVKSPNKISKGFMSPLLHSTPKLDLDVTEKKKKEYINGLNLVVKLHDIKYKTSNSKDTSGSSLSVSKPSIILNSSNVKNQENLNSKAIQKKKIEGDKSLPHSLRLLKDVTVVKIKGSINPKNFKEQKLSESVKLKTKCRKEENQLNYNDKKEVDGLKRKIKINEVVVENKKVKTTPSKSPLSCSPKVFKNVKCKETEKKVLCSDKVKSVNKSLVQEENNTSGNFKKELLLVDPDLPTGWKRMIRTKFKGAHNEKHIVYILSPQGKKFQFKWKLRKYLERMNSSLSADQFHFGLYKRTKPFVIPSLAESSTNHNSLSKTTSLKDQSQDQPAIHVNKNSFTSKSKSKEIKNSPVSGNIYSIKDKKKVSSASFEISKTSEKVLDLDGKQLLLHDPDLPFGWKRIINASNSNGKLRVYIISPEGIIFRRRRRLQEYLNKNDYAHSLENFYFGLHPKKDPLDTEVKYEIEDCDNDKEDSSFDKDEDRELYLSKTDMWKFVQYNTPMYSDPHLPEGWRRFIKIRQCGESAGRMEVILVSPDGKRHRSKLQLEQYILQNNLNLRADEFDFSVFGKERTQCQMIPMTLSKDSNNSLKRKSKPPVSSDRPVPDLEISRLKDVKVTPEGEMINAVAGLMVTSDLSSARGERRLRMPRKEHEKLLKIHLDLENENKPNNCDILINWIQTLVKCRSDFRALEPDAASLIAEKTKEFIKQMSSKAFLNSNDSKASLEYEDVAHIVDVNECLSALKVLIPKKITYKEYLKLNRPTQFMSFT